MIDKELVLDNIQGGIECLDVLKDEIKSIDLNWRTEEDNFNSVLDSLIITNLSET